MLHGFTWVIEGDVKACFDEISHKAILGTIREKVMDNKFLNLIERFLKAGVSIKGVVHPTVKGVPQGGVISPLLANAVLNKLDWFLHEKGSHGAQERNRNRYNGQHHRWINGDKVAIATTVSHGVVLGAEVCPGFSKEELKEGYGVFVTEAKQVEPEYAPETVNTDGFNGTISAWLALYPMVVLIRCFLHAWLRIRERGKKSEHFFDLGERVWGVYYSATKSVMGQRIRRLREWAMKHVSGVLLDKTLDLCNKQVEWSLWYENENAYTTSNELDRLMRSQNRYFDRGQHFHGTLESANLRSRAWAILHNYWDWGRKTRAENDGYRCPAERLNGKRYADNWLENLLVATSDVQNRHLMRLCRGSWRFHALVSKKTVIHGAFGEFPQNSHKTQRKTDSPL